MVKNIQLIRRIQKGTLLLTWGGPFFTFAVVLLLLILLFIIFWIPFLLFTKPGTFDLSNNGSSAYYQGGGDVSLPSSVYAVTADISYRPLNIPEMKQWLIQHHSALANDDVLAAVDRAAKSQHVSPYLLIAITGQEQSFVPSSHSQADQIIRNPWNVFGCWCSGRGATLTTEQSATWAANTVAKLSQGRPANMSPIEWIDSPENPRGAYAEDSGWWIGVSRFYAAIQQAIPK
jgi:hypothetical protein